MTLKELRKIKDRFRKREAVWSAFRSVMDEYADAAAGIGTGGAIDYEKALSGCGSTGYVVGRVEISDSDFVCDVEITGRRELGPKQFAFFKKVYLKGDSLPPELQSASYKVLDIEVQEIMGQAFFDNGIYPVKQYKRSVRQLAKS